LLFGERLGALTLPAALLIFAGLWLVSARKR
jgi:drug/metabolite transporter (DMT)-like permease